MGIDLFAIHDVALSGLNTASSVSGSDLIVVSQSGVQKSATVTQLVAADGAVTSVTGTAPIASSGGATPAISIAASAIVAGAAGAESLTLGSNVLKRGTKTLVAADGSSPSTITFAVAFATSADTILFTIRSTTSSTLKILAAYPSAIGASSVAVTVQGGDASSTCSVDWLVLGH
jgi:hypothetical protein